jgi:hypothetical protein
MKSANCYAARGLNLVLGLFLVVLGMILFICGFSFLPVIGFFLAFAALGFSTFFLFAPRDRACFASTK